MTETPEPMPQPFVPHPGTDPGPGAFVMRGRLQDPSEITVPPYARRQFRGWIVTRFDVRRVQRLIPIKSENSRLRYRNLSYKRKWNLVWC